MIGIVRNVANSAANLCCGKNRDYIRKRKIRNKILRVFGSIELAISCVICGSLGLVSALCLCVSDSNGDPIISALAIGVVLIIPTVFFFNLIMHIVEDLDCIKEEALKIEEDMSKLKKKESTDNVFFYMIGDYVFDKD